MDVLFGSKNSIILVKDFLEPESLDTFELQLKESSRFYEAVLLSELVKKQEKGKSGYMAVCFKHARKNFQLKALPVLHELNIPCTVFIQPECVGTNRLPLLEEVSWLKSEFSFAPELENRCKQLEELLLSDHSKAEEFFLTMRKELGAIPVEKIGPEYYCMKWGALVELNPKQFEFGLNLTCHSEDWILETKKYAESQLKRVVNTVYSSYKIPFNEDKMRKMGFSGLVTERVGAIDSKNSCFNLPQWTF